VFCLFPECFLRASACPMTPKWFPADRLPQ
jgi:hypothetical protein